MNYTKHTTKKHWVVSLVLFAVCALEGAAQPRVNNDGTVTFQYRNNSARNVMVDVQFAGGGFPQAYDRGAKVSYGAVRQARRNF